MDVSSRVLEGQDGVLISVSGEFDVHTAGQVRDEFSEAESLTPVPTVITVELSEVTFMDSTGLGVLIGALGRATAREGRIVLAHPTSRVLRLLALTGMDGRFEIVSAPA